MIPFKSFNSKQITESETDYNEFVSVLAEEYEMSVEEVETLIEDVVKEKNRYRIAGSKNRHERVARNYRKKRIKRAGFVKAKKYILDKKGRRLRLDTPKEARYRTATGRHMEDMDKGDAGNPYHSSEARKKRTLQKMSRMSKSPKKKDNSAMRAFIARSAAIKYKKAKASRPVVKKLKRKTPGQPRRLASASR